MKISTLSNVETNIWKAYFNCILSPSFSKIFLTHNSVFPFSEYCELTVWEFLSFFFFFSFWLPATCCQFSGVCSDNFIWGMLTQDQIMLMDFIKGEIQLPKCRHLIFTHFYPLGYPEYLQRTGDRSWAPQDTHVFLESLMKVWDTSLEENPKLRKKQHPQLFSCNIYFWISYWKCTMP